MNKEKCEGCYYCKVRDVDPDSGELRFGPYCLESGTPAKCGESVCKCETGKINIKNKVSQNSA